MLKRGLSFLEDDFVSMISRWASLVVAPVLAGQGIGAAAEAQMPYGSFDTYAYDTGEDTTRRFTDRLGDPIYRIDEALRGQCSGGERVFAHVATEELPGPSEYLFAISGGGADVRVFREIYTATGCGLSEHRINIFAMLPSRPFAEPMIITGFSGDTRTVFLNQNELVRQFSLFMMATRHADISCLVMAPLDTMLVDTRYVRPMAQDEAQRMVTPNGFPPGETDVVEAWVENWTLYACDGPVSSDVALFAFRRGSVSMRVDLLPPSEE